MPTLVKSEKKKLIERQSLEIKDNNRDRDFDSIWKIMCYACRQIGHIKSNCPVIKENEHPVNNLKV